MSTWNEFRKKHVGQKIPQAKLSLMWKNRDAVDVPVASPPSSDDDDDDVPPSPRLPEEKSDINSSPVFRKVNGTPAAARALRILQFVPELDCLTQWPIKASALLGIGTVGTVFLSCRLDGTCAAVKIMEITSAKELKAYEKEVDNQRAFSPWAPEILDECVVKVSKDLYYAAIVMERLGDELDVYLGVKRTKAELESVAEDLEEIFKFMAKQKLTHGDMTLFNLAKRRNGDKKVILLDFDRASTSVYAPVVDVLRMQAEIHNPKINPVLKKMVASNVRFLLSSVPAWNKITNVAEVKNKDAAKNWRTAYEEYCVKANVLCLK
jgi:hypothetical protein